jgi:hypothetical protein
MFAGITGNGRRVGCRRVTPVGRSKRSLPCGDYGPPPNYPRKKAVLMKIKVATMAAAMALAAPAANAASDGAKSAPGWWESTTISGRMYYDVTNISNTTNGVRGPGGGNGTNFDIKRFYVGIEHVFNSMFSANVTTDTTYDSGTANGQNLSQKGLSAGQD